MRFLAYDSLEGRGMAMRGHEIAAKFMAAQFEQMGLAPAGDNGTYFQSVPLRMGRPDEVKTTMTLVRGGKTETLVYRKDFLTALDPGGRKPQLKRRWCLLEMALLRRTRVMTITRGSMLRARS
jgi:hypothetical protein